MFAQILSSSKGSVSYQLHQPVLTPRRSIPRDFKNGSSPDRNAPECESPTRNTDSLPSIGMSKHPWRFKVLTVISFRNLKQSKSDWLPQFRAIYLLRMKFGSDLFIAIAWVVVAKSRRTSIDRIKDRVVSRWRPPRRNGVSIIFVQMNASRTDNRNIKIKSGKFVLPGCTIRIINNIGKCHRYRA